MAGKEAKKFSRRVRCSGFSILESIVAIVIITSAIAAPMAAVSIGLRNARGAANETIAFFLAQEAIESVRYLRDNAVLANPSEPPFSRFISCIGPLGGQEKKCIIRELSLDGAPLYGIDESICSSGCPVLRYDAAGGRYRYDVGVDTIFRRDVFMIETDRSPLGEVQEVRVRAVVSWADQIGNRSVEVVDTLHDVLVAR